MKNNLIFIDGEKIQTLLERYAAKAYIAVDSKYWMWINGHLHVYEGGLNRGPKPGAGYYDEVDLSGCLNQGNNSIAILVWYWGNDGRNNTDSGKGGFLFEMQADEICVVSDKTWKVKQHPAYISTGEPYPSPIYGGHNIGFDARMDIPGWTEKNYDDGSWESAIAKGQPPCSPWGEVFKRPVPMTKDSGDRNYIEITINETKKEIIYTAKLPYALHVSPIFCIKTNKAGLTIDVRTDRYDIHGGPGDENVYQAHRTEYITAEGVHTFEMLDWQLGEQVIYTIPKGVEVICLQYRETGYDAELDGEFTCSDEFLNSLYKKCQRTLYVCMRDNYMDCPDRERGQWIGDVSQQIPQTFYALSRSADLLTKKAIFDFILWKKEKNILQGNIPGTHCFEFPSQSLNAISDVGMIAAYYLHSGDATVLYDCYEAMKNYLALWETDENGCLIARQGDAYWFDHDENIDNAVLEYTWYYSALKFTKMAGEAIGEDATFLKQKMAEIENCFDKLFWDGKAYRSAEFYDDRANAMAALSGLAKKEKWQGILEILESKNQATPYMEAYVLKALFMMDEGKAAMKRMKQRYAKLVRNENTTLWEDFNEPGTKNHAWSGGPLTILSKYVAGIAPLSPGYFRYTVMPQLFDINKLKITVPTVKGYIKVYMQRSKDNFSMEIESPQVTTAIVGIPKNVLHGKDISEIYCGGICIWKCGKGNANLPGLLKSEDDGKYIKFCLSSGKWKFKVI